MVTPAIFRKTAIATAIAMLPTIAYSAVLEEIVVTAQKREQKLEDVPISLAVITATELDTKAIRDSQDLALASPSLIFQQGFGPVSANIALRGIGTMALEGGIQPSVSFVVDGVPLSRVTEFVADLGDVEQVEILRGPQGTLYGRNATGGAINLRRALPLDEFAGYIEQTLTDDDESTTRAMITGPLSDSVRGRLSLYHKDRDGFVENLYPGGEDLGGEETKAILGKLDIDVNENVNLLLSGEYRDSDLHDGFQIVQAVESDPTGGSIPALDGLGFIRTQAIGNGNFALGQQALADPFIGNLSHPTTNQIENWGVSADLTVSLSDELTFKSITSARSIDIDAITDVEVNSASGLNTYSLPVVSLIVTNLSKSGSNIPIVQTADDFTQEFRLEGSTDKYEWITGLFFSEHEEESISEIPVLATSAAIPGGKGVSTDPRVGGADWTTYAIFADTTYWLTESVNMFVGLRWTMEDMDIHVDRQTYLAPLVFGGATLGNDFTFLDTSATFQAAPGVFVPAVIPTGSVIFTRADRSEDWSGRFGFSWDIDDATNVYISASRGYVGAGANYGRQSVPGNSVVDPSITSAYELGIKTRLFEDSVSLNAAIFMQDVSDLQTSRLIPGTVQTETFNAGDLDTNGLELNVTWAATDLLTIDAGLTYLDTEVSDLIQPCYPFQPTSTGCNINQDNNPATGNLQGFDAQDVSGNSMIMAPDLSYNLSFRLDMPLSSMPFDAYAVLAYTYQDDIQYQLTYDPLTAQDSYGLLDAFIGIEDKEGRYHVSVFGKNITDEYFDSSLSVTFGTQGRLLGRTPRGAQAYYGIKARYNF